jgi:replication factor C subunit 3/5
MAMLHHLFGAGVEKLFVTQQEYKFGSTSKTLTVISSPYHIELSPSEAGFHDAQVCMEVIKGIATEATLDADRGKQPASAAVSSPARGRRPAYRVIVLNDVDRLSKNAQQALRRTMETCVQSTRLILVAESMSRLIDPLISRCLCLRIPAPSDDEVAELLLACVRERCPASVPSAAIIARITEQASGNLRRAYLALEATYRQHGSSAFPSDPARVFAPEYERFITEIAADMTKDGNQSPSTLLNVRSALYSLLASLVPETLIFERLAAAVAASVPQHPVLLGMLWGHAAKFELRIAQTNVSAPAISTSIVHLEAYVAAVLRTMAQFWSSFRK